MDTCRLRHIATQPLVGRRVDCVRSQVGPSCWFVGPRLVRSHSGMAEPAAAMPEPEPAASPPTVPTCPDCNMAPPCQCERTTTPTALLADEAAAEQPQPAEADDDADAAGSEEEDDFVVDIAVPTQGALLTQLACSFCQWTSYCDRHLCAAAATADGTVEHKKFNVHRNETIGNAKRRM